MVDDFNGVAGAAEFSFLLAILWRPERLTFRYEGGALRTVTVSRVYVRYLVFRQGDWVDLENLALDS